MTLELYFETENTVSELIVNKPHFAAYRYVSFQVLNMDEGMIAQSLLDDEMESLNEFWKDINEKYGDIFQFLISRKEEGPVMAGLAYIHLNL